MNNAQESDKLLEPSDDVNPFEKAPLIFKDTYEGYEDWIDKPLYYDINTKVNEDDIPETTYNGFLFLPFTLKNFKRNTQRMSKSASLKEFNDAYDKAEEIMPESKEYRPFLTKLAEVESGFLKDIKNTSGAPAYGYFQFMLDGKKYNNITKYALTNIENFRKNPVLQIIAAVKLAKTFESSFNKEDLTLASQQGISRWGLLGGAWLGGAGGVKKYLRNLGNPSDRHWNKQGKGTDVGSRIKMFNL